MTDFDTASALPSTVSDQDKARVIVVLSQYAKDDEELNVFVQMLGLVDA